MKLKLWTRADNAGDGSTIVSVHLTEAEAREGLDDDNFMIFDDGSLNEYPSEIEETSIEITEETIMHMRVEGI